MRSTVDSTRSTSQPSVRWIVPPVKRWVKMSAGRMAGNDNEAVINPVPCRWSRRAVALIDRISPQRLLPDQRALRKAGGAAGVADQHVLVGRHLPGGGQRRRAGGEKVLVPVGCAGRRLVRGDQHIEAMVGRRERGGDPLRQSRAGDQCTGADVAQHERGLRRRQQLADRHPDQRGLRCSEVDLDGRAGLPSTPQPGRPGPGRHRATRSPAGWCARPAPLWSGTGRPARPAPSGPALPGQPVDEVPYVGRHQCVHRPVGNGRHVSDSAAVAGISSNSFRTSGRATLPPPSSAAPARSAPAPAS